MENKKYKKLFKGGYGSPQYEISDDGQYLLWNDKVQVMMQEMNFLYIVDLKSGKKFADIEVKRTIFFNVIYAHYYWTVLLDD